MVRQISAGVLVWRDGPQFLLVHPGGPFWAGKESAAWSIPKGIAEPDEDIWAAAQREFAEELGQPVEGAATPLSPCRTSGGKTIHAWLVRADLDLSEFHSNLLEMEWPPRSGHVEAFPEVDRAAYFDPVAALEKIHKGQRPILLEALAILGAGPAPVG